ncbi:MAG: AsmA family protein, partial [Acidiferrobacterales bacterium]
SLEVTFRAEQLDELAALFDVSLPALGPYELSARVEKRQDHFNLTELVGYLGAKDTRLLVIDRGSATITVDEPVQLRVEGKYREIPFALSVASATATELATPTKPWPIRIEASAAGAKLNIDGSIAQPVEARRFDVRLKVNGRELGELTPLLGTELPALGPYTLSGRFLGRGDGYELTALKGRLGQRGAPTRVVLRRGKIVALNDKPVRVSVQGVYRGTPLKVSFTGGKWADLFAPKTPWPVALTGSGAGARVAVKGRVARPREGQGFDLRVDVTGRELEQLAPLLGTTLPSIASYKVSGRVRDRDGHYIVTGLRLNVDETDIAGSLSLKTQRPRPKLVAKLSSQTLAVNKLMLAAGSSTGEHEVSALDLPLPTDRLHTLDADLDVEISRVVGAPTALGNIATTAKLESGKASVTLKSMTLASASIEGRVALDASGDMPSVVLDLSTKGVDLTKTWSTFGRTHPLGGTTNDLHLHLTSSGHTLRSLIERADLALVARAVDLSYQSEVDGKIIPIAISMAEATTAPGQATKIAIDGAIREVPVKLNLTADTLLNVASGPKQWPLSLEVHAADATLEAEGTVAQPFEGEGFDVAFTLKGQ